MYQIASRCPYCRRDTTFVLRGLHVAAESSYQRHTDKRLVSFFATCSYCQHAIVANQHIPENAALAIKTLPLTEVRLEGFLTIKEWHPKPREPDVPAHLPERIRILFTRAEKALLSAEDFNNFAGNGYRATLEAALDMVSTAEGTLYRRIKLLVDDGRLTHEMGDFAHAVRTLGNAASHHYPDMTDKELEDLRLFTYLFLMYTFTLPAMLPQQGG